MSDYRNYLESKVVSFDYKGFEVDKGKIHKSLYDYQNFGVKKGIEKGRFLFAWGTGSGKTRLQEEIARLCSIKERKPSLIITKLPIVSQTVEEGNEIGIDIITIDDKLVKKITQSKPEHIVESELLSSKVYITNYDKIKVLPQWYLDQFCCVCLDESSILANFKGKTRLLLNEAFKDTQYRFCFSATPSPNDLIELINQAVFLGIIKDSAEALQRWFMPDQRAMGNYSLKPYAIDSFWRWVSSWCMFMSKPSDIGFSDGNYYIPNINYVVHSTEKKIETLDDLKVEKKVSATNIHKEIKNSFVDRMQIVKDVVTKTDEMFMVVALHNEEADYLEWELDGYNYSDIKRLDTFKSIITEDTKTLGDLGFSDKFINKLSKILIKSIEDLIKTNIPKLKKLLKSGKVQQVSGADSAEEKAKKLKAFAKGEYKILVSKPQIIAMGLNFQKCNNMVFTCLDFSFQNFYQVIRRLARSGQTRRVNCHIVAVKSQKNVLKTIKKKEKLHDEALDISRKYMKEQYADEIHSIKMDYKSEIVTGQGWELYLGDNVEVIDQLADNSVGLFVTSFPFASLYRYSNNYRDMGNNVTKDAFQTNVKFLTDKMFKKQMKGRMAAIHVKDLAVYKHSAGYTGVYPFALLTLQTMLASGYVYKGMVTIWKSAEQEVKKTDTQRLLHNQLCKDSSMSSVALPEYLMLFQKWADNEDRTPIGGISTKKLGSLSQDIKFDFLPGTGALLPIDDKDFSYDEVMKNIHQQKEVCTPPNEGFINGKYQNIDMDFETAKKIHYNYWNYSFEEIKKAKARLKAYSIEVWQRLATPVWFNVDEKKTLQTTKVTRKEFKHICPFSTDIVDRTLHLWSNEGDIVCDPFSGIATVGDRCLKFNRLYKGIELGEDAHAKAVRNMKAAESQYKRQLTLF